MVSEKHNTTYTAFIGGMKFQFNSEIFDSEMCDTQVKLVEGDVLCYISGKSIKDFVTEFKALINKYTI